MQANQIQTPEADNETLAGEEAAICADLLMILEWEENQRIYAEFG